MHCLYRTSYGPGGAERSNRKTITFGNVLVGHCCTRVEQTLIPFRETNFICLISLETSWCLFVIAFFECLCMCAVIGTA